MYILIFNHFYNDTIIGEYHTKSCYLLKNIVQLIKSFHLVYILTYFELLLAKYILMCLKE